MCGLIGVKFDFVDYESDNSDSNESNDSNDLMDLVQSYYECQNNLLNVLTTLEAIPD